MATEAKKLLNEQKQESAKTVPDEILFSRIDDCFLKRTANCLKAAGIEFVGDLCKYSKSELIKIKGLGPKGYYTVLYTMNKLGLHLADTAKVTPKQSKTMLDIKALETFIEELVILLDTTKAEYDAAKKSSDESLRCALDENDMKIRKSHINSADERNDFAARALQKCDSLSKCLDNAKELVKTYYSTKDTFDEINKKIAAFLTANKQLRTR